MILSWPDQWSVLPYNKYLMKSNFIIVFWKTLLDKLQKEKNRGFHLKKWSWLDFYKVTQDQVHISIMYFPLSHAIFVKKFFNKIIDSRT